MLVGQKPVVKDRVQPTPQIPLELASEPTEFEGLAVHDPLQPVFVQPASRAAAGSTRRVHGGDRTTGSRRRAAVSPGVSGSVARLCGIAGGATDGPVAGRRRRPLLPG